MDYLAKKEQEQMLVNEFARDVIVTLDRVFEQNASLGHSTRFKFVGPEGRFNFTIKGEESNRGNVAKLDKRLFTRLEDYYDELSSKTRIAIKKSGVVFVGDMVRMSIEERVRGKFSAPALGQISSLIIEPLGFESLTDIKAKPLALGADYDAQRAAYLSPIKLTNAFGVTVEPKTVNRKKMQRDTVLNELRSHDGHIFVVTDDGEPHIAVIDMSLGG